MKQSIFYYVFLVLLISITLGILSLIVYLFKSISLEKRKLRLRETEVYMNYQINADDVDAALDAVILRVFNEYIAFNIDFKDIMYITDELEKEILSTVSYTVSSQMSQQFFNKLCLKYNPDAITDIIAERVYMCTLNYSIQKNQNKKSIEEI